MKITTIPLTIFSVLVTSVRKSLHPDDLIPLCSEFRSVNVANRFREVWDSPDTHRQVLLSNVMFITRFYKYEDQYLLLVPKYFWKFTCR